MKEAPLLSVILPVYNSDAYLEACLSSVLGQEGVTLEVIAVDDGSTDGSPEILRRFARQDKRLSVLSTPNNGVNQARNLALEHASGDYVAFCDSDDTVPPCAYRRMLETALRESADMVIGGHILCNDDGLTITIRPRTGCRSQMENFMQSGTLWERIVRRALLEQHSIRFNDYLGGGDTFFVSMIYPFRPRFTVLSEPVYCYWNHTRATVPSIANTRDLSHFSDRLRCAGDIIHHFPQELRKEAREYIYLNQTRYFCSVLLRLRDGDELERGYRLFREFLGQFDWERYPGSFEASMGVPKEEAASLSGLDFLRRVGSGGVLPPKDFVLRQFGDGELGVRYLLAYVKAWFQFKCIKH